MNLRDQQADSFSHRLRVVVVGEVDHGKSTLIGRLLHDTGSLPEKKKEHLEALSLAEGRDFEFAFLLDALSEEQAENITIDTTQIPFRTAERDYVIIDAPGHRELLKNMITGAASAEAALLLIDIYEGIQEQTERHLEVLKLLGLQHLIIVINKMDHVHFSEEVFQQACRKIETLLRKFSFAAQKIMIPTAAKMGLNVASRAQEMPWYNGPTLVEALNDLPQPCSLEEKPLRIMIQDVYRDQEPPLIVGRVESGTIKVGEEVVFLPAGIKEKVSSLESWNALILPTKATAGESIAMTVKNLSSIKRGYVVTHHYDLPQCVKEVEVYLFWLYEQPLTLGDRVILKIGTQSVEASLVSLKKNDVVSRFVISQFSERKFEIQETDPRRKSSQNFTSLQSDITEHEFANAFFELKQPIVCDYFEDIEPMGRATIFVNKQIAGAGIILKTTSDSHD